MLGSFLLVKIIASVTFILLLSIIAERSGPKVAGVLGGIPTGSAIALFFIGLEISPKFAAESAIYSLPGLVATQVFVYAYYLASLRMGSLSKGRCVFFSAALSLVVYLLSALAMHFVSLSQAMFALLPLGLIPIMVYLFRRIEHVKIENRVRLTHRVLFVRVFFSCAFIVIITEMASFVGPKWSGLFSTAPTTLFPIFVIIHNTYGLKPVHAFIKNVPFGLVSVVLNSFVIFWAYPAFGVYIGTIISAACITSYLLLFWAVSGWLRASRIISF